LLRPQLPQSAAQQNNQKMKLKLFAAAIAAGLWCICLQAQNTIEGNVTDLEGEPLMGATIQVVGSTNGTITNEKGMYQLRNLREGRYELKFSFLGYTSVVREVQLNRSVKMDVALKRMAYVSEEYTVSAYRASREEPVSQVTRGLKEIENEFQGQDAGFLLEKLSPSVVTFSESGTNFSNYSGFRLRGMDQTRVNMTLNGVPLNDMIDQGVFFSNFTDFGNSIQSVQVQRGVGISTNGTSSYAGSINFESLNVYDSVPSAEIQLSAGSFNTLRASAELQTGRMDNNMAFYARYAGLKSDGYRDNTGTDSRSFFLSGAYFAKKHIIKFTGFIGRSQNGLAYLPVAISDIEENPRTNYVSANDKDDFGQWMSQVQHSYQINERMNLVNTIYYNGAGGDFPAGFISEDGEFTQINYPLFNDHFGAISNLNMATGDRKTDLNFGIHAYTFKRENLEQIIPNFNNPYYEDESRKNEVSVFAKARRELGKFSIFGDVQVRLVSLELSPDEEFLGQQANIPIREWTFINPKLGVSYSYSEKFDLYASLGRTGREPTRFDILGSTQINSDNLDVVEDLNSVQEEYVNDLEVGGNYRSQLFSIQANFFYMQFENEIAPIGEFIPESFVQVYKNQESSYRTGIELDYSWSVLPSLRLFGHATYMQSKISEYSPEGSDAIFNDISPILSPEWNVLTSLEYKIVEDLSVRISARYLSESFLELTNDPSLTVPQSFVTDVGLRYVLFDRHELRVDINNITDELYYTNGAPVFGANDEVQPGYFVQPPRSIFATLVMRF
jgi:iron complex outermembrane receptor protein